MCGCDRPGPEVAAAGVGELEGGAVVDERAEQHEDAAGAARGLLVHLVEGEGHGWLEHEVAAVLGPLGAHADAAQHLEDPVDLGDPGDPAQGGPSAVEQRGAEQRDGGVLRRTDVDGTAELTAPVHPQVHDVIAAEREELGVEGLGDPPDGVEREVLAPLLDPVDSALAGPDLLGQVRLGPTVELAGVADEGTDPRGVDRRHARHRIS
jgi:hypothetical protein